MKENKQRREEQERAKAESKLLEQARRKEIREQFLLNKDEREEKERGIIYWIVLTCDH